MAGADVVTLPGVLRADLEPSTDVETVLKSAMDAGLKDVALVGRTLSGEIVVFGSAPDADQSIGLLTRGLTWLASADQISHTE